MRRKRRTFARLSLSLALCLGAAPARAAVGSATRVPVPPAARTLADAEDYRGALAALEPARRACEAAAQSRDDCFELTLAAAEFALAAYDTGFAEDRAREALAIARKSRRIEDEPRAYNVLASVMTELKHYEQAAAYLDLALRRHGEDRREADAVLADIYQNTAFNFDYWGKYEDALRFYAKDLAARSALFGASDWRVVMAKVNLASCLKDLGRYEQSDRLYAEAEAMLATARVPELEAATLYQNWSVLKGLRGDFPAAETLARKALAIRVAKLPADDPMLANSYDTLAVFLTNEGRYTDALASYEAARTIRERHVRERPIDVATSYGNTASLLIQLRRFDEAERFLNKALDLQRAGLPKDHADIAWCSKLLANVYLDQRRFEAAVKEFETALRIYAANAPEDHPIVLQTREEYGIALTRAGRPIDGERELRAVLLIARSKLGAHPTVGLALDDLAETLTLEQRFGEADVMRREALSLWTGLVPEQDPRLIYARDGFAALAMRDLGRPGVALAQYRLVAPAIVERTRNAGADPVAAAEFQRRRPIFARYVEALWRDAHGPS